MLSRACARAFGPRWPSNPVGPHGPRVDSCGGHDFLSRITTKNYYKELLQRIIQYDLYCMIVRERAFGPCGGRAFGPSEREARRQQKMAAIFGF